MAEDHHRSRFIPFRKADIVDMCIRDAGLTGDETEEFRQFSQILEALFHFEFQRPLETLKNSYAPFNPDTDTRLLAEVSGKERKLLQKQLVDEMTAVLNAANFERITAEDLAQALAEESLFKIRLEVDFDDFEDVIFFAAVNPSGKKPCDRSGACAKRPFPSPITTGWPSTSNLKTPTILRAAGAKTCRSCRGRPSSSSFTTFPRPIWKCSSPTAPFV